jgi:hypothetical protein
MSNTEAMSASMYLPEREHTRLPVHTAVSHGRRGTAIRLHRTQGDSGATRLHSAVVVPVPDVSLHLSGAPVGTQIGDRFAPPNTMAGFANLPRYGRALTARRVPATVLPDRVPAEDGESLSKEMRGLRITALGRWYRLLWPAVLNLSVLP